jgi:hypothetical protein
MQIYPKNQILPDHNSLTAGAFLKALITTYLEGSQYAKRLTTSNFLLQLLFLYDKIILLHDIFITKRRENTLVKGVLSSLRLG